MARKQDKVKSIPSKKRMHSRNEVVKLINDHSEHIYKGYYVYKFDLEDILDMDDKWIKENLK